MSTLASESNRLLRTIKILLPTSPQIGNWLLVTRQDCNHPETVLLWIIPCDELQNGMTQHFHQTTLLQNCKYHFTAITIHGDIENFKCTRHHKLINIYQRWFIMKQRFHVRLKSLLAFKSKVLVSKSISAVTTLIHRLITVIQLRIC